MSKSRTQIWLALIVLAVGLVPAAILGLFVYIRATATPLHPDTQKVPSVAHSAPLPKWAGAVEQGRLKLDYEIQTYVPAFPQKEWPVTLRQLMGHLAGVRTDSGDEGPLLSAHCERP